MDTSQNVKLSDYTGRLRINRKLYSELLFFSTDAEAVCKAQIFALKFIHRYPEKSRKVYVGINPRRIFFKHDLIAHSLTFLKYVIYSIATYNTISLVQFTFCWSQAYPDRLSDICKANVTIEEIFSDAAIKQKGRLFLSHALIHMRNALMDTFDLLKLHELQESEEEFDCRNANNRMGNPDFCGSFISFSTYARSSLETLSKLAKARQREMDHSPNKNSIYGVLPNISNVHGPLERRGKPNSFFNTTHGSSMQHESPSILKNPRFFFTVCRNIGFYGNLEQFGLEPMGEELSS